MKSFTPFIVIAICIGMYYLYIGPTYADIGLLSAKKAEYTDALANAKQLTERRDAILEQYNAINPGDVIRLKQILPDGTNNVDIVTNINAIASQYGMVVRGVKISAASAESRTAVAGTPKSPYTTTNIVFTTTGPYQQFTLFLRDLESNVRLFDVVSLSIGPSSKSTNGGVFDYTLGLTAYSLH